MKSLEQWLKQRNITEIECIVSDLTGIARGKIMPTQKFCDEGGIRLPESVMLQAVTGDYVEDELYDQLADPADIDLILKPDPKAVFMVPWAQEPTAQVIHEACDRMGNLNAISPRNILKKVLALYEEKGWQPIVAPEMEFYLTNRCDDPDLPLTPPIGRSGRPEIGRKSYSIDAANEYDPIIEEIYDWCEEQELDIDTLIHEEGTAQMEFNFRHGDALSLADQVFVFKRTVREAALKHKVAATFMAKPISKEPGSAMHIHTSVIDRATGKNLFSDSDGTMSDVFYGFIAGLQKYIPAAMPMFAPNVNSYRRFLPNTTAPTNMDWGVENRTVALRVPESDPANRRIENRIPGADTNPYLAMAANLLCGLVGVEEGLRPTPPVSGAANYHLPDTLPTSLENAIEEMEACSMLEERLGWAFVQAYAGTRRAEHEAFKEVISSWEREYLMYSV